MEQLEYLLLRLIRKAIPNKLSNFLLQNNLILKSGLESSEPQKAIEIYKNELQNCNKSIEGSNIIIFGYGGYLAVGVLFLQLGAKHVYLIDKYATLDNKKNLKLIDNDTKDFLYIKNGKCCPNPNYITLIHDDIVNYCNKIDKVDIIVSMSVFEHIFQKELDKVIQVIASLTKDNGINLHFIDLQDHFAKYPFNMLFYSQRVWDKFLNPDSNLNRLRLNDYKNLFQKYFKSVNIDIIKSDIQKFKAIKHKIRKEFLTNDDTIDSACCIKLIAKEPLNSI